MKVVESARYEGPPNAAKVQAGKLPVPPGHDPDKPTAVVLLSNQGSEVTDVLAPYEVLSESGAFNVYTAAPDQEPVTLSGGLDVLPQLTLAKLDRRLGGEDPYVIVVRPGDAGRRLQLRVPGDDGVMGILDASDTPLRIMTCRESIEVLPGKRSEISAYRVERDGKFYLNPTIGVRTGANFSTELDNGLDEDSTVHWHGLHVDWRMDGHPPLPLAPNATYRYAYPVENWGGTYWYHPE